MVSVAAALPYAAGDLFASPPLVGRREQLERLEALLGHPPALIAISGELGMGKTSLLAAFGRRAAARDWRVVQPPPLVRDTDRDAMVRTLRILVGLPETLVQATGETPGEQLLGRVPDEAGRTAAVQQAEDTLLAGLTRRRTVLLLDGYQAAPEVEHWLLEGLLADLRAAAAPVVAVIAGHPSHMRGPISRADEVLDARLPTEAEVREFFSALGALLDPPAAAAEVEVLAAEGASEHDLIGPLVRALGYARIADV